MTVRPLVSSETLTGSPLTLSTFTSGFLHWHQILALSPAVFRKLVGQIFLQSPHATYIRRRCNGILLDEGVLSL